jgi:hypothetical protein
MTLLKRRSAAARIEGRSTVKRFVLVAVVLGTIVAAGTACWLRAYHVETIVSCSVFSDADVDGLVNMCKHEAYIRAGRAALTGILAACVVWDLIVAAAAHFMLRLWRGREWEGEVASLRKYALITSAVVGVILVFSASITWPSLF